MKKILTRFLIIELLSFAGSNDEHSFKIETIDSINETTEEMPNFENHYFVRLKDEEKENLCITAKGIASLDGMIGPGISQPTYNVHKYSITDLWKNTTNSVGMRCETIPRSYLVLNKMDDFSGGIKILLRWNRFESYFYLFKVEVVQLTPIQISNTNDLEDGTKFENRMIVDTPDLQNLDKQQFNEAMPMHEFLKIADLKIDDPKAEETKPEKHSRKIDENKVDGMNLVESNRKIDGPKIVEPEAGAAKVDEWHPNRLKVDNRKENRIRRPKLLRMYPHEHTDLCVAAKKRIKFVVPVLLRSDVDQPRLYEVTNPGDEEKRKFLAVDCSSSPPMYVYFGSTERDVHIILVRSEPIDEKLLNKRLLASLEK